jgi:hypothetical protein
MKHLDFRISGQSRVADLIHEYGFFIGNHHVDIKRELDDVVEILERLGV